MPPEACESFGSVQGPAVEVLKAELAKPGSPKRRKSMARSERPIKELDSQCADVREVVGTQIPRPHEPTSGCRVAGDVTAADGQQEASLAEDIQPVAKKQAVARQVSVFRDPVLLVPKSVPDDLDVMVAGRSSKLPTLMLVVEFRVNGVTRRVKSRKPWRGA